MSNENKTHYRKVFKSDHLGCADIEDLTESGSDLIFTIKCVVQEYQTIVAGKKIDANIAYFNEQIKPLVLNATNSKTLRGLTGSVFVEDWNDITIQLYADPNVKMKGETVGGVRISPRKVVKRPLITQESPRFKHVITAYKRDGDFDSVLKQADISQEAMKIVVDGVANGSL